MRCAVMDRSRLSALVGPSCDARPPKGGEEEEHATQSMDKKMKAVRIELTTSRMRNELSTTDINPRGRR